MVLAENDLILDRSGLSRKLKLRKGSRITEFKLLRGLSETHPLLEHFGPFFRCDGFFGIGILDLDEMRSEPLYFKLHLRFVVEKSLNPLTKLQILLIFVRERSRNILALVLQRRYLESNRR